VTRSTFLLLLLLPATVACASTRTDDAPREVVRVASDLDNRPFAFVDDDGRPAGRDVEMMEHLALACGLELQWRRTPFAELLEALERGEADVVCATLGVTPERRERVEFTRPCFETTQAVLVRAGEGEPQWLSDLAGRRVAASGDTTSGRAARARLARSELVLESKAGLAPGERLLSREVDAVVLDRPAADAHARESAGALRVLDEQLAVERYALAVRRERADLRERLDLALRALADTWAELDGAYGLAPERPRR
jgi:polar amino acid transport system substrate-binding protein